MRTLLTSSKLRLFENPIDSNNTAMSISETRVIILKQIFSFLFRFHTFFSWLFWNFSNDPRIYKFFIFDKSKFDLNWGWWVILTEHDSICQIDSLFAFTIFIFIDTVDLLKIFFIFICHTNYLESGRLATSKPGWISFVIKEEVDHGLNYFLVYSMVRNVKTSVTDWLVNILTNI